MRRLNIFLSGQKNFGKEVFQLIVEAGHNIVGVCVPLSDRHLLPYVKELYPEIDIITAGTLRGEVMPDGVDLGVCAHSFDYVGRLTRYRAKYGWIGYHPSLLPRHRGRSSIEWAIRMGDMVTGGTVYWLNSGIDRGDTERQEWAWLHPGDDARTVWREVLQPMGVRLLGEAIGDISRGVINKTPQDVRFSTFEPSLEGVKDIYRPDLLLIGRGETAQKTAQNG